jgi:hypothetical protein
VYIIAQTNTVVSTVITNAWSEGTRETYGSGILHFHVFCDKQGIAEQQRAPASTVVIAAFISALAGLYAAATIRNYVFGVRAWHILHGIPWQMNQDEVDALLKAAQVLTPATSKKKKREPWMEDYISTVRSMLDLTDPLHVAVYACLTTTFYSAARLGEFVVKSLTAFNPQLHVKPSDVRQETDKEGRRSTVFHLPRTKTALEGEEVSWSRQDGDTDPEASLALHLNINKPPQEGPLFAYKTGDSKMKLLTKSKFLEVVHVAARRAGLEPLKGHGIHIGATLCYLLKGVPFPVMKVKGRWASDAFETYLRKHAQILAPYMQAKSKLHEEFIRLTMPQIRR